MTIIIKEDGTIKNINGKTHFFSFEYFRDEICAKGHCFICGAPKSRKFNNEHIFPDWVLKACDIYNEKLTLPNDEKVKYGTYKIPCCAHCNSQLGSIYETPISRAFSGGYDGVFDLIRRDNGAHLLRAWLSLIFLKVHLRDFQNQEALDSRINKGMIGQQYDLHELHHIHAVARAPTAGVAVESEVFGSLFMSKITPFEGRAAFDYGDSLAGRTMFLQIKDVLLIYVLDDCNQTSGMLSEQLAKLPFPLNPLQVREIYARYSAANMHILSRPDFLTKHEKPKLEPIISVLLPELEIAEYEPRVFGTAFALALRDYSDNLVIDGLAGQDALAAIAEGNITVLFDENGEPVGGKEASP